MRTHHFLFILSIILLAFACSNASNEAAGDTNAEDQPSPTSQWEDPSIELPDGFSAIVVADSIGRARHIAVRDNGDIYVQLQKEKNGRGVAALRDEDGDGHAERIEYFGNHTGTGMAIHNGYIYCSSNREVYRYPLPEGDNLVPDETARVLVVGGFPDQSSHEAKSIAFDDAGHLYVNVGAPSNACMKEARTKGSKGIDPCPQREWQASIWQFDANTLAQTQKQDGVQFAAGLRNCVALEWNPVANELYAVQHGRDQLHYLYPDIYDEENSAKLPAEEFVQLKKGDDYGWPYCYFDQLQDQKMLAPEYGGDAKTQGRCADKSQPILAFPGHMAPNDLLFYTANSYPEKYHKGAFIAFHGSWNRNPLPQKGYFVAFVPMQDGRPSGDWEIFADNIDGIEVVENPRDAKHRPTGLAIGPDGALYIADSVKGKIWKVAYNSQQIGFVE